MRFTNLKSNFRKPAALNTLKWMLGLHPEKRPSSPSTGVYVPLEQNNGRILQHSVNNTLTWIGQASFFIQLGGINCLIDPVFSKKLGFIKRNSPPGLLPEHLPHVDVVFITHNHRDHMDEPSLRAIGHNSLYVVPQGLKSWFTRRGFNRVIEMKWWQREDILGLDVTFVPAEHWSRRSLTDINTSWWGGYVISKDGLQIYHSGDSGWFDGFIDIAQAFPNIDVALLPTGAYAPRWFMKAQHIDPNEAVAYFKMLNAKKFFSMHWGTFKLSDEPLDESRFLLPELFEKANLSTTRLETGILGKTFILDKTIK